MRALPSSSKFVNVISLACVSGSVSGGRGSLTYSHSFQWSGRAAKISGGHRGLEQPLPQPQVPERSV